VVPLDAGAECSDHELFAKGRLEACTASRCTEIIAMPRGATPLEPTPPPRAEWDLRTRKACFGTTCRAPGAKLTAELVRRGKLASTVRHHELEVAFTIDLRLAVVVGPLPRPLEIWDVAKDTHLAIQRAPNPRNAGPSTATVVGRAIIIDWLDGVASIHDGTGQLGSVFRAGLISPLDDARVAVIGWSGSLTTLDLASGKQLSFDPGLSTRIPFEADLVRLDAKQIAILWIDDDSRWTVARIFFPVGASPTVATQKLATCK